MWGGQFSGGGLIYGEGYNSRAKQTDTRTIQEAKSTGLVVHWVPVGIQRI